jgi:hypothetical protein
LQDRRDRATAAGDWSASAMGTLNRELGVLVFKRGYAAWSAGGDDAGDGLAPCLLAALDELRAAGASLG